MALQEVVVASRAENGPLVRDVPLSVLTFQLLTYGPPALLGFVNQALVNGLQGLPEGARMELTISGWTDLFGNSWADKIASRLQEAWEAGEILDPDTGQRAEAWPEHPQQVAFAAGDSVTLRMVKNSPIVIILGIGVVVLALLLLGALWAWWRSADWIAKHVQVTPGEAGQPPVVSIKPGAPPPPGGPGGVAGGFWDWLKDNAALVAGGAAVLIAAPFVIRQIGEISRARREAGP